MTPKEKAQELIDNYAVNVDIFCTIEFENYIPNGLLTNKSSVKLAIIAVNEILKALDSDKIIYGSDYRYEESDFWKLVKI